MEHFVRKYFSLAFYLGKALIQNCLNTNPFKHFIIAEVQKDTRSTCQFVQLGQSNKIRRAC